jgi:hypothetical protein
MTAPFFQTDPLAFASREPAKSQVSKRRKGDQHGERGDHGRTVDGMPAE